MALNFRVLHHPKFEGCLVFSEYNKLLNIIGPEDERYLEVAYYSWRKGWFHKILDIVI